MVLFLTAPFPDLCLLIPFPSGTLTQSAIIVSTGKLLTRTYMYRYVSGNYEVPYVYSI